VATSNELDYIDVAKFKLRLRAAKFMRRGRSVSASGPRKTPLTVESEMSGVVKEFSGEEETPENDQ
jgi:hypothetical protein